MPGFFYGSLYYFALPSLFTPKPMIMRKILLLLIPVLSLFKSGLSQSFKGSYNFQKAVYPTAAVQVPYDEDRVTDAIKDYMLRKGYKDSHYKDFLVFRSVPLDASGTQADLYFNISRKSRSEKDITIVNLLPVKKGETLTPAAEGDSSYIGLSQAFIDTMIRQIHSYSLNQEIIEAQKNLDKTSSKLTDLKNDSGDIAKKIRSYEADLEKNKNDQASQTKVISSTATGDQDALSKAHKKMDKLLDNQADYEKKLRNYKADLEQNTKDRQTQQALYEKESEVLAALKQRYQNVGTTK